MKILIVADSLLAGGAEWFLLRQYTYLKEHGYSVQLCVTRPDHIDSRIMQNFPQVQFVSPVVTLVKIAALADKVLGKLFKKTIFLNYVNKFTISNIIKQFNPDVIHSHLLQADYKVFLANRKTGIRHVVTIHGDYIELIKKSQTLYLAKIRKVLGAVDCVVFISAEQCKLLNGFLPSIENKAVKIYNGYPQRNLKQGPSHDGFYFGMIARGISEKGWEDAILAFLKLNDPRNRLLLYGEGDYLEQLKRKYSDTRILFRGFTSEPLIAIQEMDAGLFPSYYQSESLPTTVIEYLLLHKPVITTHVGECAEMIRQGEKIAGIVLELKNGKPDVDELAAAMQKLSTDKAFYRQCSDVAMQAKNKFGMEECMNQYLKVYKK